MMTTNNNNDATDLLETLNITKISNRMVGGSWVTGTIAEHCFEALVFPEHADCTDNELDDSRISKLCVQRISDRKEVASFDRGWDVHPATPKAKRIVDLLAAGLAEAVFTPPAHSAIEELIAAAQALVDAKDNKMETKVEWLRLRKAIQVAREYA